MKITIAMREFGPMGRWDRFVLRHLLSRRTRRILGWAVISWGMPHEGFAFANEADVDTWHASGLGGLPTENEAVDLERVLNAD